MNETTDIHDYGNKEKYCGQSRISLCGAGSLFYYAVSDPASDPFVVHDPVTGIGKADFYSLIQHLVPQGFQSWMLSIIDEMFSRTIGNWYHCQQL